jgi:hypothetical protein
MEWFYGDLAGLAPDPDAPGFKRVRIRPQPVPGITWARASHLSPRGRVSVAWSRDGGSFSLEVELPPNTSAEVRLPDARLADVTEGGRPLAGGNGIGERRQDGRDVVVTVGSGRYRFAHATPR